MVERLPEWIVGEVSGVTKLLTSTRVPSRASIEYTSACTGSHASVATKHRRRVLYDHDAQKMSHWSSTAS